MAYKKHTLYINNMRKYIYIKKTRENLYETLPKLSQRYLFSLCQKSASAQKHIFSNGMYTFSYSIFFLIQPIGRCQYIHFSIVIQSYCLDAKLIFVTIYHFSQHISKISVEIFFNNIS